ncbi:MAG: secondary thiamine-phosphate synthase enzyme YjbQ [Verrucomicrobiales bacterium]|nr:secondary thiamine-phosphate synthase enzyme YjbQ [Verrucomicrobiales bacterium]
MKFETQTREFEVRTSGKGTYEISSQVRAFLKDSGIASGQMTVFVRHTSASLVIMENADAEARTDLHAFFDHLVPENLPFLVHTYEGPDDSPSHLRMALTRTSEVIPIYERNLALGTWQGIFLFEHRRAPHVRKITMSIVGTPDD